MTLFENDDDASSFFDHFTQNLPSPGLAPPYAASPADLLFDMEGGMVTSPQFLGFSGDEPSFDMVGGTSPTRMNYFPPPSGDSIGNSNPFTLAGGMKTNYPLPSDASHLLKNLVSLEITRSVLGNEEQIIIMSLNVMLKQAYFQVDFSSEKSKAICSSQAVELESRGGMIMERISVSRQWRYAFCSKTPPWSVIIDVVVKQLRYLDKNNSSFGIPVNDDRSSSSVNTKMPSLLYFERTFLEMQHLNSVEKEFLDHFERLVQTGVLELVCGEEIKLQYLQGGGVGTASQKNHSVSILPPLLEAECRMMQLFGKGRDILKVIPSAFKRARHDFGITLEEVGTASAEYNAAAGREGMLLQQEDSSSEPHIPESSPTNEERNNVVELNNSIDAKGGNSSSEKTDTISRWEKDHGITRQVLEQLFGKSRDDAAKTLEVSTSTFKRACRDFGINRWPNQKGKRPNCSLNQKQDVQAVKKHKGIIQGKSGSEGQIPESSGRIEEANNNGLKRIGDAKGNSSSSSSKKKDYSICRWQEDYGITREVLEQQCDKNRDDAAKTLKVSTSTLKRACRDLGINRWPTRNRKRPNSSLNQNAAVKKRKGGGTQPCPPATNIAMPVKATYQNDTVAFRLSSSSTMKYLEEQLEMRFKIAAHKFCIKYQDEEDEWISIMCDLDLMYCMDVFRSCGKSVIRMRVTPKSLQFNPNQNENYFSSPVLPIQAAQPPANAASPVASLSNCVGLTGSGQVVWEIREAPNTTPILLSEGNNTSPQIVSDHSVNIEYFNQEDQELLNLAEGMMVTPPRINHLSPPLGDYLETFELVRESLSPHSIGPQYGEFHCANRFGFSFTRFGRRLYDDEESSDVSQELENREENEIVRQSWFEILTLPLRSAWKGMIRIWRNKYCCCLSTPK
nr:protein NLP7-like [Ipomoea batatas]